MAREEEEKEEAMCLTYDRPEIINKVVFKRNKTTGTWEIIVPPNDRPSKASQSKHNSNKKGKKEKQSRVPAPSTKDEVPSTPSPSRQNPRRFTKAQDPDYSLSSSGGTEGRVTRSSHRRTSGSICSLSPATALESITNNMSESPLPSEEPLMVLRSRVTPPTAPPISSPVRNCTGKNSSPPSSYSNHVITTNSKLLTKNKR